MIFFSFYRNDCCIAGNNWRIDKSKKKKIQTVYKGYCSSYLLPVSTTSTTIYTIHHVNVNRVNIMMTIIMRTTHARAYVNII